MIEFGPSPPVPRAYGLTAAIALTVGLFGGFLAGLYVLGVYAFGWPAERVLPLVQAHGQAQVLGFSGLLIVGVAGILLPGFWSVRLAHPGRIPAGGLLVGLGLAAQLIGQPFLDGAPRLTVLMLAALLPPAGFVWAGLELGRTRLKRPGGIVLWEALLLLAAASLLLALTLRAALLLEMARGGGPAALGASYSALLTLELDGFLLAATIGVQLRLLPSLARTASAPAWAAPLGAALLAAAVACRALSPLLVSVTLGTIGAWLLLGGGAILFLASGLLQRGIPPVVQAPATRLPGRTRWVLRAAWLGLLLGLAGRAGGMLSEDAARHALTSVYLIPLALVVGVRLLPRVSAYPIRFTRLTGAMLWLGLLGGALRAFGGQLGAPLGWQLAWAGGLTLTLVVLLFALLAWSPWGVPRGQPRQPEVHRRPESP